MVMGELVFVGMGLHDERDLSIKGIEEIKSSDKVFVELYTSLMAGLNLNSLERICGKELHKLSRRDLEDYGGEIVLKAASSGKAALLVPGDPMIATTHVDLRIRAERKGIKTRIVHAPSILSAVIGLSGLQSYKFGRCVTIPFPEKRVLSETPYRVIADNKMLGLHTLCLLDIIVEEELYMTVNEGLKYLMEIEKRKKEGILSGCSLAVGVARAGSAEPVVKADIIERLIDFDFGPPPHSLVIPGKLHFVEAEALVALAKAPEEVLRKEHG